MQGEPTQNLLSQNELIDTREFQQDSEALNKIAAALKEIMELEVSSYINSSHKKYNADLRTDSFSKDSAEYSKIVALTETLPEIRNNSENGETDNEKLLEIEYYENEKDAFIAIKQINPFGILKYVKSLTESKNADLELKTNEFKKKLTILLNYLHNKSPLLKSLKLADENDSHCHKFYHIRSQGTYKGNETKIIVDEIFRFFRQLGAKQQDNRTRNDYNIQIKKTQVYEDNTEKHFGQRGGYYRLDRLGVDSLKSYTLILIIEPTFPFDKLQEQTSLPFTHFSFRNTQVNEYEDRQSDDLTCSIL